MFRWYPQLEMRLGPLPVLFLSAALSIAVTTGARSQSAPPSSGAQPGTVHFDNSSTATLILQARGEGVQVYTCTKDADWAWKLKAPDATLFDSDGKAIGKHFAGPTWRLNDGSEVQGKAIETQQQPGTIPWLILAAHSTGGQGRLSQVDVVRRIDTHGGAAPSTGCDAEHAGAEVRIPYSAIYSFFDTKK
jgi:Protein of unknown function (DUF3455)